MPGPPTPIELQPELKPETGPQADLPASTPETHSTEPHTHDSHPDQTHLYHRIEFLYKIIEDTQNTVRFIDTKAVFCVTLLSGMAAVTVQHPVAREAFHHIFFSVFMITIVLSLLVCLRVIFPTIRPHISDSPPAKPRFYVGHNKAHHWILHTVVNPGENILSENKTSYLHSLNHATDHHLLSTLAETVLTLAFIRQIKSDRLHTAMFMLIASVMLFATIMILT